MGGGVSQCYQTIIKSGEILKPSLWSIGNEEDLNNTSASIQSDVQKILIPINRNERQCLNQSNDQESELTCVSDNVFHLKTNFRDGAHGPMDGFIQKLQLDVAQLAQNDCLAQLTARENPEQPCQLKQQDLASHLSEVMDQQSQSEPSLQQQQPDLTDKNRLIEALDEHIDMYRHEIEDAKVMQELQELLRAPCRECQQETITDQDLQSLLDLSKRKIIQLENALRDLSESKAVVLRN